MTITDKITGKLGEWAAKGQEKLAKIEAKLRDPMRAHIAKIDAIIAKRGLPEKKDVRIAVKAMRKGYLKECRAIEETHISKLESIDEYTKDIEDKLDAMADSKYNSIIIKKFTDAVDGLTTFVKGKNTSE